MIHSLETSYFPTLHTFKRDLMKIIIKGICGSADTSFIQALQFAKHWSR